MKIIISVILLTLCSGCAITPKLSKTQDKTDCNLVTKKLELETTTLKTNCKANEIVFCLTAGALTGAVTGVISGSIVLAGNTLHWIEQQGKCEDSVLNTYVMKHNKPLLDNNGIQIEPESSLNTQTTK